MIIFIKNIKLFYILKMETQSYESFYDLFKGNLKEIFYPIKKYLKCNKNKAKKQSYIFFKKHNILLNNSGIFPIISNFNKKFYFFIENYKKIKQIKLYINENKYYKFWTCGEKFTQYYFKYHLKRRIYIKNEESFESINLDDYKNCNYSEYYLYPPKSFKFEENINFFLKMNLEEPPKEIEFIIEKGKFYSKYVLKKNELVSKNETFFHNQKIGMTISNIIYLSPRYIGKVRILYLNIHYIFSNDTKRRKEYFLFFLCFLFQKNEREEAFKLLMDVYYKFAYYDGKYEILINNILNIFKNDNKRINIIFDDIHSIEEYYLITNIKSKLEKQLQEYQKKIIIEDYISINDNTFDIIKNFYEEKKPIKIIGECQNKKLKDDLQIIIEYMKNKENYIENYKNIVDNELKNIFFNICSFNMELNLVKLLYYINNEQLNKEDFEKIVLHNDLKFFYKYLYIYMEDNNTIKITFRNIIIHSLFKYYYSFYYTIFNDKLSKEYIINLLRSEKGYNLERNIIYSILIGKYSTAYNKVDIQRIYCLEKCENFPLNNNALFYQNIPNAPIYDFALLIQNRQKEYIAKSFQVSILKDEEDLKNLGNALISYDLRYFCDKINRIKNINIKYYSFGIIISYESYKTSKKKVNKISDFCLENEYEFLLYDINTYILYYNKSKIKGTLELEKVSIFELFDNTYLKKHQSIIKYDAKIPKKLYINKIIKNDYYKDNIIGRFKKKFQLNIDPILIAKFNSDITKFEQNDDNLIFYYISKIKNKAYIYYKNYKISGKSIDIDNLNKSLKTHVLVYAINEKNKLSTLDFSNFSKKDLTLEDKNKEKNKNYLIIKKKEEIYYDQKIENNNVNNSDSDGDNINKEESDINSLNKQYDIGKENLSVEEINFISNVDNITEEKEMNNNINKKKNPGDSLYEDSFQIDSLISDEIYCE